MQVKRSGSTMEVDIHGLREQDARDRLLHLLDFMPPQVTELCVIHGYNRGTVLRDMVRGLSHPRIRSILPALTDGKTCLVCRPAPQTGKKQGRQA